MAMFRHVRGCAPIMIVLSLAVFVPLYTVAFGLLAFLPRWRLLLAAAAISAGFCIWNEQGRFRGEEALPDVGAVFLFFVEMGFIAGFIACAFILSAKGLGWRPASRKLVLPIAFLATPLVLLGMPRIIGRFLF
jgi:hypothetical protein